MFGIKQRIPKLNSSWQHKNGNLYEIICVSNLDASNQEEYPITIVYKGHDNRIWSRPLSRWYASFTEVKDNES